MEKLLIITPHLSTGGLPQFLLKKIEILIKKYDIYLVEWDDITGGRLVVQKSKIKDILGDKLITIWGEKTEILNIINDIKPNIIHFEEFPETFISLSILDKIFIDLKNELGYVITETTHGTGFHKNDKKYFADKTMFVSNVNYTQYYDITNDCDVIEFPVDKNVHRNEKLIQLGLDPSYKHVMNVGLFNQNKNQGEIFEYAKLLSDKKIQFHFFGNMSGNFQSYWKPIIENKPDNCKIWDERNDLYNFYSCMDLFLFTSKLENRPLSVIEALSYDLPIMMYNLQTYGRDFTKFDNIQFLTDDLDCNSEMINVFLNLENKNIVHEVVNSDVKISAYHMLTDIDTDREVRSQISLTQLEKFGIDYTACINKRWTELPPVETCEYPEKVSMEPGGRLTPGHYGCYLAHKDAFYRGKNSDSDFIFIFECDAVIDVDMDKFIKSVDLACDILNKNDLLMFSFGFHNGAHILERNDDYWVVNGFYGAHAYLIPRKSFHIIDNMYKTSKWNVTDLLFSEKLDQYKIGIFREPLTKQAGGLSILDKVEHEDRY